MSTFNGLSGSGSVSSKRMLLRVRSMLYAGVHESLSRSRQISPV